MARRSQRLSSGSVATPKQTHKRLASSTALPSTDSKRSKTKKETPTKSQYFSKSNEAVQASEDYQDDVESTSQGEDDASDFEHEEEDDESAPSDGVDDDYSSDSDDVPKSKKKTISRKDAKSSPAIRTKSDDVWKSGVKAGLGPGTELRIKKPQARPAGSTPYRDDTIHPNTLLFLKDLKANNQREWLKLHDAQFRQSERDWHSFVEKLTEKLTEIDDTVPELPVKDVIFRIYRDVRFSSDPTPYKPHFSAAWSRTGRKGPYAHYYVQVSPGGKSFVGGGLWHPEAAPTAAMRRSIDRHPQRIKSVLMEAELRKEFLGGVKSETKAVEAFVSANSENALKTKPKGFDSDHAELKLLRLRNYTIGRQLEENEVIGADGLKRVSSLFRGMKPFITFLNSVVMPDGEEEEEEDESGEESEEDEDGEDDE